LKQEPYRQSQQTPGLGPTAVPLRHALLDAHHPQPERAVHALQVTELAHGSGYVFVQPLDASMLVGRASVL
jgi:hypothetical protein